MSEAIVTHTYTRIRFPHATTAHVCGHHFDHAGGLKQPLIRRNKGQSYRETIQYRAVEMSSDLYSIKLVLTCADEQRGIYVKNDTGSDTFNRDAMFAKMAELETSKGLTRFPDAKRQRKAISPQHWQLVKYNEERLIRFNTRKKPPILTAPKAEMIKHQNGKRNKPRQVMIIRLSSNSDAPIIG